MKKLKMAERFTWTVFLPLAVFLVSCGGTSGGSGDETSQAEVRPIAATLAEASSRDIREELFSVGRVVSRNTPTLAAEINARVIEIGIDAGEAVTKGQVLLRLDPTAFELAKQEALANIQRLTANIENEKRRVSRYRDLKTRDMMPQERLDDAEAMLAVETASLAAAEAQLAITQDRLSKTVLVSPVDGAVEKRHVSVGDYVQVGGPLVSLTDTVNLRVELPFPETVGNRLAIGQVMHLESAVAPGLVIDAVVDDILPQVSAMNHSLLVISHILNPGPWRPQATVDGFLVVDFRPGAVTVPAAAVVKRPAGDVLYRIDSRQDEQVQQVTVKTGVQQDSWIEIIQGIEAGSLVVVEGAHFLSDGARVAVQETPQ